MIKYWASSSRAATLAILQLCPVTNYHLISLHQFGTYLTWNEETYLSPHLMRFHLKVFIKFHTLSHGHTGEVWKYDQSCLFANRTGYIVEKKKPTKHYWKCFVVLGYVHSAPFLASRSLAEIGGRLGRLKNLHDCSRWRP